MNKFVMPILISAIALALAIPIAAQPAPAAAANYNIEDLIKLRQSGNFSLVVLNGNQPQTFNQRGVADLFDLLQSQPALLKGATAVDKVIGKGAAALMIAGGVKRLHTGIICTPAISMLRAAGIEVTFDTEVEYILNMTRSGWCPLEARLKDIETAKDCLPIINTFVTEMKKQAAERKTKEEPQKR